MPPTHWSRSPCRTSSPSRRCARKTHSQNATLRMHGCVRRIGAFLSVIFEPNLMHRRTTRSGRAHYNMTVAAFIHRDCYNDPSTRTRTTPRTDRSLHHVDHALNSLNPGNIYLNSLKPKLCMCTGIMYVMYSAYGSCRGGGGTRSESPLLSRSARIVLLSRTPLTCSSPAILFQASSLKRF
jgi:hypothetical protein